MYANVTKIKVFLIATPHSAQGKVKPTHTLVGQVGSTGGRFFRKYKWSLPFAELANLDDVDLLVAGAAGVRKLCGSSLAFTATAPDICVQAVNPDTGELLGSTRPNMPTELNIFMVTKVMGMPYEKQNGFARPGFYNLDLGDIAHKRELPAVQEKALKSYQGRGQWPSKSEQPVRLNYDSIRTRLQALLVKPTLIDTLTKRPLMAA